MSVYIYVYVYFVCSLFLIICFAILALQGNAIMSGKNTCFISNSRSILNIMYFLCKYISYLWLLFLFFLDACDPLLHCNFPNGKCRTNDQCLCLPGYTGTNCTTSTDDPRNMSTFGLFGAVVGGLLILPVGLGLIALVASLRDL